MGISINIPVKRMIRDCRVYREVC